MAAAAAEAAAGTTASRGDAVATLSLTAIASLVGSILPSRAPRSVHCSGQQRSRNGGERARSVRRFAVDGALLQLA